VPECLVAAESTSYRPVGVSGAFSKWRFKFAYSDRLSVVLLKGTFVNGYFLGLSY
jgi:hypothetical protein